MDFDKIAHEAFIDELNKIAEFTVPFSGGQKRTTWKYLMSNPIDIHKQAPGVKKIRHEMATDIVAKRHGAEASLGTRSAAKAGRMLRKTKMIELPLVLGLAAAPIPFAETAYLGARNSLPGITKHLIEMARKIPK